MIILLWIFTIMVMRRLYVLWNGYSNQDEMDTLIYNNSGRVTTLRKLTQQESNVLPQNFISTLHRSFMNEGSTSKFNEIYNDFLSQSENKDYSFTIMQNILVSSAIQTYSPNSTENDLDNTVNEIIFDLPSWFTQYLDHQTDLESLDNEYEIDTVGDPSLLNKEETEEVKDIKKDFKELMDLSFEFKEKISSGDFVSMMDKMKEMYDKL